MTRESAQQASTVWRHIIALAAMVFVVLAVSGCGAGTTPFAKNDSDTGPKGKPVPPIAIKEAAGLPANQLAALTDALVASAAKRDMAIVEGAIDGNTLLLAGNFQARPEPGSVVVVYNWMLSNSGGQVLHTIAAEEATNIAPGPDPWAAVTPAVLQRIAAFTAENLSSRLSQLGYATQVGGLPPPLDSFQLAGAGADKEMDYETLHGPGAVPPGPIMAAAETAQAAAAPDSRQPPADDTGPAQQKTAEAAPIPEPVPAQKPPPAKKEKTGPVIKAVAVLPVTGAPGKGNDELTSAMRTTLKSAGWPVIQAPRKDALTIAGTVELSPPNGATQKVALAWTVKSPDGKVLGTVKQANDVSAGSLDRAWNDAAVAAAEGGAIGIFDLIKKFR